MLSVHTSEDVKDGLKNGLFGMVEDTGTWIQKSISAEHTEQDDIRLGYCIGHHLFHEFIKSRNYSIINSAYIERIPCTIHVGIGTDIINMNPKLDHAILAQKSHNDFRLLCDMVGDLSNGGVYINIGSAVHLPEVFLKAFSVAQNLGANLHDFTTINMDMYTHYRTTQNVLNRPASVGGTAIELNGRHEIMIPLLAALIKRILEMSKDL